MLPKIIIHNAVSVDGRMDWISVDLGLFYSLIPTWKEDATLCGSETILKAVETFENDGQSDPTKPLLVVVDSRGRFRSWSKVAPSAYWRGGVALCSRSTPGEHLEYLKREGVQAIVAGEEKVELDRALEELRERFGVRNIRVDSGGALNGALLRAGLVDEVSVLVVPQLIGGEFPRSIFRASDLTCEEEVINLKLISCRELENGHVWLRYEVEGP